jgi:N-hydroxyarylamine O-acetyltransferase
MPLDVDAYLRHLECPRPAGPDLATLRALHLEHQHRVPFENLDVVRGIPLSLDIDRLQEKVLVR